MELLHLVEPQTATLGALASQFRPIQLSEEILSSRLQRQQQRTVIVD